MKQAGIDTSDLEAEVERRRKAIEEKKRKQMAQAQVVKKETVPVKESGIFSGMVNFFNGLINAAIRDSIEVDPNRIKELTLKLNQGEDAGLQKQLENAVTERLIEDIKPKDVRKTACVIASLWVDLKLAGANVEEFGEFYARWAKKGMIRAKDAFVHNQKAIAQAYGFEVVRIETYTEFEKLMKNGEGVKNGVLRFYNENFKCDHNVNLYNNKGGMVCIRYRSNG